VSTEARDRAGVAGLGGHPIRTAGRPDVVRRWVPAIARGEAVAAFALSEPDAGSDAGALSLPAEAYGDGGPIGSARSPQCSMPPPYGRTYSGASFGGTPPKPLQLGPTGVRRDVPT